MGVAGHLIKSELVTTGLPGNSCDGYERNCIVFLNGLSVCAGYEPNEHDLFPIACVQVRSCRPSSCLLAVRPHCGLLAACAMCRPCGVAPIFGVPPVRAMFTHSRGLRNLYVQFQSF